MAGLSQYGEQALRFQAPWEELHSKVRGSYGAVFEVTCSHLAEPTFNPAAEAFKNFDQDTSNTLLGSLNLDAEDEPRRGASRANSVRFDESALHGHLGQVSRSSSEFFPVRTGSGMGSHPMTERSSSHKSEGRQSSAGQSTYSARLNSLVVDPRPTGISVPQGPPPGLLLLGPLPSVIRCWLSENFSNESLLYAAVCTGSYKSVISSALVRRLNLERDITESSEGRKVSIQVFLPEATIQQSSLRYSSPAPQVPSINADFMVQEMIDDMDTIQIVLGSDVLRAKSADVIFSQEKLLLLDEDRNRLSVPLVRPENSRSFQSLLTTSALLPISQPQPNVLKDSGKEAPTATNSETQAHKISEERRDATATASASRNPAGVSNAPDSRSVVSFGPDTTGSVKHSDRNGIPGDSNAPNGKAGEPAGKSEGSGLWGSWRRDSGQSQRPDSSFSSVASANGYQKPGRGRGMKVLRPSRTVSAKQSSDTHSTSYGAASLSWHENISPHGASHEEAESLSHTKSDSSEKSPAPQSAGKPRNANPVGGASAFGWLNPA
jgi:hypothetical protein